MTNFCAPVFFLLAGTGAWLSLNKRSKTELSRFLATRGLWLVFLELVLFRCFAMQFNFDYHVTAITVLWALGWAMIVLSLLVYLPAPVATSVGIVMIAAQNMFDSVNSANPLWSILHSPNVLFSTPGHLVFLAYPLITAAGYGLGQTYAWSLARRRVFLLRLGIGVTTTFVVLRAINIYGDAPRLLRPAVVIGKVPLFYYLVHFALIHVLAVIICYMRYGHIHWMFESPDFANFPITRPDGWGLNLPLVYLIWAFVVVALYPLCRWFAALKRRSTAPWLSYL